jgi:ring-1,2-phenylacetyl-CoA epoxidase subunit PaaC
MTESIRPEPDATLRYLLRIADCCLIHSHRLAEWCGHAPVLEEDIALTNMALDLLGQARATLAHAGQRNALAGGIAYDEDQLAFLRDERDYLNPVIAELPRGDFAFTVLRNAVIATWLKLLWERLQRSTDPELAAIAAKALKEARYHQRHAADWVARLGDGTAESIRRLDEAMAALWRFVPELFESDAIDATAEAGGLGPSAASLREPWLAEMAPILVAGRLEMPPLPDAFRSDGRNGRHSEHMGYLLATMQTLQRSFPDGVW